MTTEFSPKKHWENIYNTKSLQEVSWYQPTPATSLNFIQVLQLSADAAIIDIGGGDSFLVDHLLNAGYTNLTVLDISEAAIHRAKARLGNRADHVTWIVSDINEFKPTTTYDLWHDRAAFHFLTDGNKIKRYVDTVHTALHSFGSFILGTFSENGPKKCSGIDITQYSQQSMASLFTDHFVKIECTNVDHPPPFNTVQNFTFCVFKKKTTG